MEKDLKIDNNIINCLTTVPASDANFKSNLQKASVEEILEAISVMTKNGQRGNASRIKACSNELQKRDKTMKPCPFCGGEVKIVNIADIIGDEEEDDFTILCDKCGTAVGFIGKLAERESTINAWNQRKMIVPQSITRAVEQLKACKECEESRSAEWNEKGDTYKMDMHDAKAEIYEHAILIVKSGVIGGQGQL